MVNAVRIICLAPMMHLTSAKPDVELRLSPAKTTQMVARVRRWLGGQRVTAECERPEVSPRASLRLVHGPGRVPIYGLTN